MNKGFAYYFKQAFKISAKTVWKNKNLLKSMLYFFTSLVARLTVIMGAMVSLADVRQAKIAKNQQKIDVPQSLTRASQKPMWTMIVATVIEFLIYIGGFLLVSVICGAVFAIGLAIAQFISAQYFTLICIIFAVPCLIIYAVYTIIVVAIFAPTAYVIDSNPNLSAGETVSVCVNSMYSRGKMTVILSVFIPSLIIGLILGVCAGGFMLITAFLLFSKFYLLAMVLWAIVSILILGFTVPVFVVTKNLSLVLLFEDIALDPVNAQKRTAGINIKRISGARVDREEVADNLGALFDNGIEEKYPEPEELVHKHKKKNKSAAAAQAKTPAAAPAAPQPAVDDGAELEEVDDYADEAPAPEPAPAPQATAQAQTAQAAQPQAQPRPAGYPNPAAGQPGPAGAPNPMAQPRPTGAPNPNAGGANGDNGTRQ